MPATITITYRGPADGTPDATIEMAAEIPAAIMPYFFGFQRQTYGPVPVLDEKGQPKLDPKTQQPLTRDMTEEECLRRWARGVREGSVNNVDRYVDELLAAAAKAQKPSFDVKPIS